MRVGCNPLGRGCDAFLYKLSKIHCLRSQLFILHRCRLKAPCLTCSVLTGVSQWSQDACQESSRAAMTMPVDVPGVKATQGLDLAPLPPPSCRASLFQLMLWVRGHFSLCWAWLSGVTFSAGKAPGRLGSVHIRALTVLQSKHESHPRALAGNAFQHKFGFKKPILVRSESAHRLYQSSPVHSSSTFLLLEIKPFGSSFAFSPEVSCCTF